MAALDAGLLAHKLGARYGLSFSGGTEEVDGGTFAVIRPDDLSRPNGFGIVVARTPRLVEAIFRPDSFAGRLLRLMSEAGDEARGKFASLASRAVSDGFRVSVAVNGNPVGDPGNLPEGEWTKFELDCDARLPAGRLTDEDVHAAAFEIASLCMGLVLTLLPLEDVPDSVPGYEPGLPEGAKMRVEVNRYERSPTNRAACIAHYGVRCQACRLDFGEKYGDLGRDFIEVHHRVPVSAMGGSYRIDPVRDLVPVCGNCHSMLHRQNPPLTVEQLRMIIAGHASGSET